MSATTLDVALRWSERRAEVRELLQLLGSDYERTVEPWRELVRLAVARTGRDVPGAVLAISRSDRPLTAMQGAVLLAAALDVLEERDRTVRDA